MAGATTNNRHTPRRRGAMAIMTAALAIPILAMLALAVDVGYMLMTRTQLQAAADAGALAGGTELLPGLTTPATETAAQVASNAALQAVQYAARHRDGDAASVYVQSKDVRLGRGVFNSSTGQWDKTWDATPYNMVGITLHRDVEGSTQGDRPLPLFFGAVLGMPTVDLGAKATAVLMPASGLETPTGNETVDLLPFTLRDTVWQRYRNAQAWHDAHPTSKTTDNPYVWTPQLDNKGNPVVDKKGNPVLVQDIFDSYGYNTGSSGPLPISSKSDGVLEVDLYPSSTGAAGNSGTIDLGNTNNSSADLGRQISSGVNAQDFQAMATQGMLTSDGLFAPSTTTPVSAQGETGISGGQISKALNDILGQPRAIALFTTLGGTGNNAQFGLTALAGVRVMNVQLTGNNKHVWVQFATFVDDNAVPDLGNPGTGATVFAPLVLIE